MAFHPNMEDIAEDECCTCGSSLIVAIAPFGYPFCAQCDFRAVFLDRGSRAQWPPLSDHPYTVPGDVEFWLFNGLFANEDRIIALLCALDEYEENRDHLLEAS